MEGSSLPCAARKLSCSTAILPLIFFVSLLVMGVTMVNHYPVPEQVVAIKYSAPPVAVDYDSTPLTSHYTGNLGASRRPQLFSEVEKYQNMSHEYDQAWTDILPKNGGFMEKLDWEGKPHRYGISMFHQLHCLSTMRDVYQKLVEDLQKATAAAAGADQAVADQGQPGHGHESRDGVKAHPPSHFQENHWLHCFNYLRQV